MFERARTSGLRQSQTTGRLGRFLGALSKTYKTQPIVYGQHIYVVADDEPVTIFLIPPKYRKLAEAAQRDAAHV